jgi:predicted permease
VPFVSSWFTNVRRGRRAAAEEQLDKELRFHLDQHVTDLIATGHGPQEARRLAYLALGGPEQVKEGCRDSRGTRWFDDLAQDVRYAVRTLRQRPGFAAVALLTLALGTGATTVIFTVINGVLLKPLSYPDPDRLVTLSEQTDFSTQFGNRWGFAYPNFIDCQRESRSLTMAATRYVGGTVSEPGEAEYVDGRYVSPELFAVLGVPLARGRAFLAEEDRPGAAPAIIVSDGLWQRRFGASPAAIGARLVLDGKAYTVVGVTPAGFRFEGDEAAIFIPLGQDTPASLQNRNAHRLRVLGRLRPGATVVDAQTELALVGRQLAEQHPASNKGRSFIAETLRPDVGNVRSTLWLLFGAVGLVLLIACVNVASLLLARAVSRSRELAMRMALGARRSRLVRQCLTESAVLGLLGGTLGVLVAAMATAPFVAFWPGSLPRAEQVQLDWRVLLFIVALSLLASLLFGLAPALKAPSHDLERTLRAGPRTMAGSSRRLHNSFVMAEIGIAVVLLVSAAMVGRALFRLSALDTGIDFRNVLVTRIAISPGALANPGRIRAAWQDMLDRARRTPGVTAASLVDTVPMRAGNNQLGYSTTAALPPPNEQPLALATSVTPDYLSVMGLPLRRGRFINDHDRIGGEPVVVIDDVLAHQAFNGREPVGERLWIPNLGPEPVRVVGVVGHVRHWGLASDDQARVRAQFYYPLAQVPDVLLRRFSGLMSIAVRTTVVPLNMVEPLRREVRGAANDQVLYRVRTMEQLASDTLARQRFLSLLLGIFAGLALLLACVGIYGVLAYLTGERVPEFGVRLALGASAGDVIWLVLRQSLGMIVVGVSVGVSVALAAGRILQSLVEGIRPSEPTTFAIVIPILVVAALIASAIPARRASRVDPIAALRQE